jgi:hypothetical protein
MQGHGFIDTMQRRRHLLGKRTLKIEQVIMKWRMIAVVVAGLFVAGCDGNPFNNAPDPGDGDGDGDGGGGTGGVVPEQFRGNLQGATYSTADGGTLTVQIQPLDASPQTVTFDRDPTFDTAGYQAFTSQETDVNRFFVALFEPRQMGRSPLAWPAALSSTRWSGGRSIRPIPPLRHRPVAGLRLIPAIMPAS